MKIECVKQKLESAVAQANRVTGKNVSLPVLQCILLEAKENQLIIKATNLDIGIEITVPVRVTEEGVVAVPGDILGRFLAHIPDDSVVFSTNDSGVSVVTQSGSTTINTVDHEDFPTLPKITDGSTFTISSEKLITGLQSVVYASAYSSMKPELASVYITPSTDNQSLVFVATDSFRLAEKYIEVKNISDFEYILIPARNALEIVRLFEGKECDVQIRIDEGQIALVSEGMYVTSRTVDGTFPDYKQIIPTQFVADVTVLKKDLLNSIKRATIFTDKFNKIIFSVLPKKKTFKITTRNNDIGESVNNIDGAINGDDMEITFNHKYIVDGFQSIEDDSTILQFSGEGKPMVMKGVTDTSFTYLVMPMNQ